MSRLAFCLLATLLGGAQPCRAVAAEIAAVVSQQAAIVTLIDVDKGEAIGEIELARLPASIVAASDGRTLFITHPDIASQGDPVTLRSARSSW